MADYFMQMSAALAINSDEQKAWLKKYLPLTVCDEDLCDPDEDPEVPLLEELKREAEVLDCLEAWDSIREAYYQDLAGPEWYIEKDGDDGKPYVWFHADEGVGSLEHLAEFIRMFLRKFDIKEPWSLTWSETCSKPRLDAFGGGAVVVSKDAVKWLNTGSWVNDTIKNLEG